MSPPAKATAAKTAKRPVAKKAGAPQKKSTARQPAAARKATAAKIAKKHGTKKAGAVKKAVASRRVPTAKKTVGAKKVALGRPKAAPAKKAPAKKALPSRAPAPPRAAKAAQRAVPEKQEKKAQKSTQAGTPATKAGQKRTAEPAPAAKKPAATAKEAGAGQGVASAEAPEGPKGAKEAVKAAERAKPAAPAKPAPPPKPPRNPYVDDKKFLEEQRQLLLSERLVYQKQAEDLRAEAESLALEREPGDVQFDEESGEGGTVAVDRERDLTLSAQAVATIEEIDEALAAIDAKTYGMCENCGQPIPKARLRALPYARLCIACKSGGLHRR